MSDHIRFYPLHFCQKPKGYNICCRLHSGKYPPHLDRLCPGNYSELYGIPTCPTCMGLLETPKREGLCNRQHGDGVHYPSHPYDWCPGMSGLTYCPDMISRTIGS